MEIVTGGGEEGRDRKQGLGREREGRKIGGSSGGICNTKANTKDKREG